MNAVDICLATYNGEKYIEEFLISLHTQKFQDFRILVSDDGSTDDTLQILEKYREKLNIIIITNEKPRPLGPAKNFMYLLGRSSAPYVMLADQDDVWHIKKIGTCLAMMFDVEGKDSHTPVFVFSDYSEVDDNLNVRALSGLNKVGKNISITKVVHDIEFTNYVPGCTAMINRALVDLSCINVRDILMHDWWLMLLTKYNGGRFGFVELPLVLYRQHANNVIGIAPKSSLVIKALNFCRTPISKYFSLLKQFDMVSASGYRGTFLIFLLGKLRRVLSDE